MNVLFVTGIFPPDRGGPASSVPRMAAALARRGHYVEVICLSDRLDHDDREHGFRIRRLPRTMFWPARVFFTALTIWRAAGRHDVVYVNGLSAEAALAAWFAKRPTVHKVVGDYAWERAVGRGWFTATLDEYQTAGKNPALWALDFIRTFPLRMAESIIVPSRYLHRIVSGWGIFTEKLRTIYNAPPPDSGKPATASPFPAWPGKTLLTACRLVPWKGVAALIRLLPDLPETRLVVAGDGMLRAELEELAHTCGVANRALFLGDVPHAKMPNYLRRADAFVLNSTYEGLPHVVLEAMAAGVPVIATDAGGTGEVVEHERTGLLVPVGDTAALKRAVKTLWQDAALRQRLVEEANGRLKTLCDPASMIEATEAVLLAAAAKPRIAASAIAVGDTP